MGRLDSATALDAVPQPYLDDGDVQLYHGDVIATLRALPAGVAQTCVTSPPYWGLRDYGTGDGQIGLEATPDQYVERMVAVFREVWRVLRDDGTVWLNLGDSYHGGGYANHAINGDEWLGAHGGDRRRSRQQDRIDANPGLKPKDLVGIPWRVAFALQTDGWYLRSDIIWNKPNPMPESVTDRPTKAHEYLFLLAKQPRYYWDADAIREPGEPFKVKQPDGWDTGPGGHGSYHRNGRESGVSTDEIRSGRNRRSVWTIPTEPFPEAHFATYPQALVRPCILAGTSEKGECVECGAPWVRETDGASHYEGDDGSRTRKTNMVGNGHGGSGRGPKNNLGEYISRTTGWRPSCDCGVGPVDATGGLLRPVHIAAATRPQTVLDPFIGSGTTALVARNHARRCIGIDLSSEYLAIAGRRLQQLSLLGGTT